MLIRFILALIISLSSIVYADEERRIAITIDDAPMPNTRLFTGIERTKKIIQALQNTNVEKAGLFVLGENLQKDQGKTRLKMYDDAGHMISNHTYSHPACSKVSVDFFKREIDKCHEVIKGYKNFTPLFRYPYLDKCDSMSKKKNVDAYLKQSGYGNGYVTVVTLDYYVNSLLQQALKADKQIDYGKLRDIYIETTLEYVEFQHDLGKKVLGYHPAQVLLLHENDINALYLEDMIDLLQSNGWQIISPEEAYKDPNAVVLSSIAAIRKRKPHVEVSTKAFSKDYLKNLIESEHVFRNKIKN